MKSSTPYTKVSINPLFQNQSPLFLLPTLFRRISKNPSLDQLKVNKHSVDYHPRSGLTSKIHPPYFYNFLWALSPPEISFSEVSISHDYCGNFQIYGVQITRKCYCVSKNWIWTFLIMPSTSTPPPLSPKSLINHSPQAVFFRKSVPFSGKEGNCGKNIKNINLKNKLFANVLRKICGRQSLPPSSIICIIYRWLLAYWTGHFMESNVFILTSN